MDIFSLLIFANEFVFPLVNTSPIPQKTKGSIIIPTNIFTDKDLENLNKKSPLEIIKELELEVSELKNEVESLKEEPSKLTKLTQDFLSNSSEDAKQQRINLIDKTNKFADLQAKFASLRSEDKHVHTQLSDLESENLSLVEESRLLNKPISEIQADLDKLLSERLIVENKLLDHLWEKEVLQSCRKTWGEDFSPLSDLRSSSDYRQNTAHNLLLRYYYESLGINTNVQEVEP